MVKKFSTVRDTQRGSQSYMEKRRGGREIEVTRRRRGGIKKGECNLASNQFSIGSPQSGEHSESFSVLHRPEHPRNSQSWLEKRRGREEIEVTWGRKRRVKKGRE